MYLIDDNYNESEQQAILGPEAARMFEHITTSISVYDSLEKAKSHKCSLDQGSLIYDSSTGRVYGYNKIDDRFVRIG